MEKIKFDEQEIEGILTRIHRLASPLIAKPAEATVGADDYIYALIVGRHGDHEMFREDGQRPYHQDDEEIHGIPVKNFWKSVKGKKVGDTIPLKGIVPDEYAEHAHAGGQAAEIDFTIKEIKHFQLKPKEEWIKESGFETEEEMRNSVRQRKELEISRQMEERVSRQVMDHLIRTHEFTLPDELIAAEIDHVVQQRRLALEQEKKPAADMEKELEELRVQSRNNSLGAFKSFCLVDRIAKKEKIFVTEPEITEAIRGLAAGYQIDPAMLYEQLQTSGKLAQLRNEIRETKVMKLLRDKAKVKYVDPK